MVTILSLILFFSLHFPFFPKQSFYSAIFGSEGTSSQLASPNRTVASGVSNHHPPHVNGASFGHHTAGGPCQCCQSLLPSSFNGAAPANIRYRPCLSFFLKLSRSTRSRGGHERTVGFGAEDTFQGRFLAGALNDPRNSFATSCAGIRRTYLSLQPHMSPMAWSSDTPIYLTL